MAPLLINFSAGMHKYVQYASQKQGLNGAVQFLSG